jgi:hypothetical protein
VKSLPIADLISRRPVNSDVRHFRLLMERRRSVLAVPLVFLCTVTVDGQARPATCEVRPLWVGGGVRSATLPSVGRFRVDGREGETIRSFKDSATGFVVTAAIDYEFEYSSKPQKPYEIRLTITVADKERTDIFESVDSAEASTRYTKKWNLSVTKNVRFEDLVYMFTLRCWDGAAK